MAGLLEDNSLATPAISSSFRRLENRNMLSARNQFPGVVKSVKLGVVTAEIVISAGGLDVVSSITRESAERMGLAVGDKVTALIKASDVLIANDK
jgi:molybdopterin-binding protein